MNKYEKIYEYIKDKILRGIYGEKTKIPSKRMMADIAGVSINTVEIAYLQLMEEGYIESRERSGHYVAELDYLTHMRGKAGYKKQENKVSVDCTNNYVENAIKVIDLEKDYQYNFSYGGVDPSFPFGIWKKINREIVDSYQEILLKTVDGMGYEPLRESICNYLYETRSIVSKKENILISSGTENLFEILFHLWDEDLRFGLENPGFERWLSFLKANKVEYSCLGMDNDGVILQDIRKNMVDIVCVTPNHQFPTGRIMPISRRLKLLDWAIEKSGWIIEDDYDGEFKYTGNRIPALKSLDGMDRVIYMGTFSSTISPAIRVSYMILPDELLTNYKEKLSYMRCSVATMTQIGLDMFIRRGYYHRHVNRMKKIYKSKREIILNTVESCDNIECMGADAGLHMVMRFKNMDEKEVVKLAQEKGIKLKGLSEYYIDEGGDYKNDSVLIGFAVMDIDDIKRAADELKNIGEV